MRTGAVQRPGASVFLSFCAKCHQADGSGKPLKYPKLAGNPAVLAPDATSLMRLLVEGGSSPETIGGPAREKMPGFADKLTSEEMARVLTFVRSTWGDDAGPVTTHQVASLRAEIHKYPVNQRRTCPNACDLYKRRADRSEQDFRHASDDGPSQSLLRL